MGSFSRDSHQVTDGLSLQKKDSALVPLFLSIKRIGYYCISFDVNRLQQRKQKSLILLLHRVF